MPWPILSPDEIADRAAGTYEQEYARVYALRNPGAEPAIVDARSPTSLLAIDARVLALSAFDLQLYLPRLAQELMPDTAVDWLDRHAAIWGVPRVAATVAVGTATFTGANDTPIPSGLALTAPSGVAYQTTAVATIASGTATVPIAAVIAGSAGSLPAGTLLQTVSPLDGLSPQIATVASGGLSGADQEAVEPWRARILQRIRRRGASGDADDFEQWTREVHPACIVKAMSPGTGLVTVAFAMPSGGTWRTPTSPEIAAVTAWLNDSDQRKPLGAPVIVVVGATIQSVNFSLSLSPDTAGNRAAALNAIGLQMLADATIGGTIYMSRIDAALANASGETYHSRAAPSADVTAAATTLSVAGTVTFT